MERVDLVLETPEALADRGLALAERGQVDDAINLFREAIRRCPDYAQAHHNLAIALADRGRFAEAEEKGATILRFRTKKPRWLRRSYAM